MKKRDLILIFTFLIMVALFVIYNLSYARYESNASINVDTNVASWVVKINNTDITGDDDKIEVSDISWESSDHSNPDKIAPGMKGSMDIEVDATGTDTAIKYYFNIEDARNSENYILTITGISSDNTTIYKIDDYHYYGILTLEEIKSGFKPIIKIDLEWTNDETNNERDSSIGVDSETFDYYNFEFDAVEYLGES